MKVAIIGSRSLIVKEMGQYLPKDISEIVSGGAKGIDRCAEIYAQKAAIKVTVFVPEYNKYGRAAPLKRNLKIIDYADEVVAFWDGKSRGTRYVIENCKKLGKKVTVHKF